MFSLAVFLRLFFMYSYGPALLFFDSVSYLDITFGGVPVAQAPDRPSGYPFLLRILLELGHNPGVVTFVQHGASLATGTLAYVLLLRLGVRRWLATAAAAIILLDAYSIILGQTIMPSAFFAFFLMAGIYVTIGHAGERYALVLSGLLFASAALIRFSAFLVIGVWLAYLVWRRIPRRRVAGAAVAALLPVAAYAGLYAVHHGEFSIGESDGWFLYGRTAEIADCAGRSVPADLQHLCATPAERANPPTWFVWNDRSPAHRAYGDMSAQSNVLSESNEMLRRFSTDAIKDRPFAYARVVARDLVRTFDPTKQTAFPANLVFVLPEQPDFGWETQQARRHLPDYSPGVRRPAGGLRSYADVFHTPRLLVGLLLVVALAAVVLGVAKRRTERISRRREIFLLAGAGTAVLVMSVAVADFDVRYLVPVAPLLVCAGVVALAELIGRRSTLVRPAQKFQSVPRVQG